MITRTNSPKQSSFSKRSGLALLISSMFMISACGPNAPRQLPVANGAFPQQVTDTNGTPISVGGYDLNAVQASDWNVLKGSYGGSLYYYTDEQEYTIGLSERSLEGRRFAFAEFRSSGTLGSIGFSAYFQSAPATVSPAPGLTYIYFVSSQIPAELVSNWVGDDVVLVMRLATRTQQNGSKTFDPTQSLIYILDCAVSVGVDSCSNQYDPYIAGFLNNFGKR